MAITTIIEDYVSFNTAKLLKQKGFDIITEKCYILDNSGLCAVSAGQLFNGKPQGKHEIPAPTLQMAMKWLREVHDICIYCYNTNNRVKQYGKYEAGASWIKDDVSVIFYNSTHSLFADIYEQTIEKVLEYCLTNLIK